MPAALAGSSGNRPHEICHLGSTVSTSNDCRLVAGCGPGPIALTVNLALSMVADLRPVLSLANLHMDESQVLSGALPDRCHGLVFVLVS